MHIDALAPPGWMPGSQEGLGGLPVLRHGLAPMCDSGDFRVLLGLENGSAKPPVFTSGMLCSLPEPTGEGRVVDPRGDAGWLSMVPRLDRSDEDLLNLGVELRGAARPNRRLRVCQGLFLPQLLELSPRLLRPSHVSDCTAFARISSRTWTAMAFIRRGGTLFPMRLMICRGVPSHMKSSGKEPTRAHSCGVISR